MANPYLELTGATFFVSCKPVVDATNTEDVWRSRASKGLFVKVDSTQTDSRGHGLLPIEFVADDDTVAYGRLESVQGSGERFTAVVCVMAADGYALGNNADNDALTDADIGQTLKGAGDGKLKIAAGGFGRVVGGDQTDLRVAWNLIENVR